MPKALQELGVVAPSRDEAWRQLAIKYARDHVEGRADAGETTAAFYELVCRVGFEELYPGWHESSMYALYDLDEHMGWGEAEGRSYDGTPAKRVRADVRRAAEEVLRDLAAGAPERRTPS